MIFIPCLHHSYPRLASRILYYQRQNMFGTFLGPFSILVVKAFSATVPQPSPGSTALSDAFAVPSQSLIHGNASSDGPASGNDLAIACDYLLGSGLRVTSCKNLFPLFKQGTHELVFAERTSHLQYDVSLPFRIQSRKLLECPENM